MRLHRQAATVIPCLYAVAVFGWAIAHRLVGDGYWLLALANSVAVYFFAPLPLVVVLSVLGRTPARLAALASALLFFGLFGGAFIPTGRIASSEGETPAVTVMTYNVLADRTEVALTLQAIQRAQPDLIGFQELRLQVARELERHLEDEYPYRTRVPLGCGAGVAIWSRYPLESEQIDFPAPCQLQSALVDLGERRVRVVNVHAQSHTSWRPRRVERNFALRREQIETILAYVEGRPEPLILMGDMNSAPMHEVIQLLTARLHDAFSDAGRGFGHTFPATSGRLRGVYYPSRLMRLDYVFHSDAWTAERAWLAEWDGYSDHLAVLARLRLRE
ncbi:MAG: hypothetical protein GX601_08810 [Anaerolineales bacterium]|nr:hypothetical protein [Anaerolineales bacterium]